MSDVASEPIGSEEEIWKAHILKARASRLSDTNYCKKNALSVWRFSTFKKKLGMTKPKTAAHAPKLGAFVKAIPLKSELPDQIDERVVGSRAELPDARWLAEFVTALLSKR
jgi:hypothetical protein